jgi:hypothetical protein
LQKSRSEAVWLVVLGGRRCVTRRRRDDKSLSDIQQHVSDGCSPKQRTGMWEDDPPRSSGVLSYPLPTVTP